MTSMQYFLVFLVVAVYILALLVGGGILLHKPKRRPHYGFSASPEDTHTGDDARPSLPMTTRTWDYDSLAEIDDAYPTFGNGLSAVERYRLSEQIRRRLDGGDGT